MVYMVNMVCIGLKEAVRVIIYLTQTCAGANILVQHTLHILVLYTCYGETSRGVLSIGLKRVEGQDLLV